MHSHRQSYDIKPYSVYRTQCSWKVMLIYLQFLSDHYHILQDNTANHWALWDVTVILNEECSYINIIAICSNFSFVVLRWMPKDLIYDMSSLVHRITLHETVVTDQANSQYPNIVDHDLCCHLGSPGSNELNNTFNSVRNACQYFISKYMYI